ncbi:MAG: hypothetical protein A2186_02950 [Candidatus Levybacteria bacterium RIFOXYA1_FULL_41_10]|nr:MAG: VanW family protein [Candidatus Levybacteria bacterium GW2011_GWA2_41_15]KKS01067.1 MAG: VanW family protein [Candidatus Levybacteria bacterium GW2011_GWB1_41_21]OGH21176.1 MAG: hypothetical protein A2695_03175 [Candidatus Levybacteria bacterium RIFCSPHIGHO2_01_FULL_40_83]OGH25318.1 MAG: hypothetical protein A3D82_00370 [Candidatus Levybacteria bacterium RIFCSPHIGHO2_02_FULL_40_29]OGH32878.1 MAG: hypothetical protein A3E70_02680 [Candidatus Levybacteria bacterium RIFCSPHIGHO2_12_FULL_40
MEFPRKLKWKKIKKTQLKNLTGMLFWFLSGVILATFLLSSFSYIFFQKANDNKVYPGIKIDGVNFGKKTQEDVKNYYVKQNEEIKGSTITFSYGDEIATVSAKEIDLGYDSDLLSQQTIDLGRGKNPITNLGIITYAYFNGINLSPSYRFSEQKLNELIKPSLQKIERDPVDAAFSFENGRVVTFKLSENGKKVDKTLLHESVDKDAQKLFAGQRLKNINVEIPVETIEPEITTESVNDLGIKELLGSGTSLFQHSIETRVFNINLATSRISGVLIPPGEEFSFNKTLGDVSAFTGYKQAYVIQNGRTVLGDGGGVCQVSTTFFRALLNAGLPIVERNAHAYRVQYYEQDSPPGIDATIYVPTVDLKFKNDTDHHILVQSAIDPVEQRLTFFLYGTKDGREVTMTTPVIGGQSSPPEPKYEDDPTLPLGQTKQVDFAAWGANVSFNREVKKNGKVIISDRFVSNYRPWQAVFLRGTKTP